LKFLFSILFSQCLAVPDLSNVVSLSKTFNSLVITSTSGIGVYDLNSRTVSTFFSTVNPKYGVLSPDGTRIFYFKNNKDLCYYNIPSHEEFYLTALDFTPEKLGVGQRSLMIKGSGKQILLDYSGFPIPDSLKERYYNFASEEVKKPINLPPILNPNGNLVPFSTVLFDSLSNLIFVGTRGYGVFVYSRPRGIYVDTVILGLPKVKEIIACGFKKDTLYLLTQNSLTKLTINLKSQIYYPTNLEPTENFLAMDANDSTLFLISSKGRIYTLWKERIVFENKLNINPSKVFEFKDGKILFQEGNSIKLMTIDGESLTILKLPSNYEKVKASITKSGIPILLDGRIFLYRKDSLFALFEKPNPDKRIIDFVAKDDTLWAITFDKILKITAKETIAYPLPFQEPEQIIFSKEGHLYIVKGQSFATFTGKDFNLESLPLLDGKILSILPLENQRFFITTKFVYLCQ